MSRFWKGACALLLLCGCVEETGEPAVPGDVQEALGPCGSDREVVSVLTKFRFGREEPRGVSQGTDLDGVTSDVMDARGCFQSDTVSPEGDEGIDNQFAKLLPSIEAVGGEAIEGLLQGAINSGELLIMMRMSHVDDLVNDACISVEIMRGMGSPEVGTHGFLEPGQTFDEDPEVATALIEDVVIEDGEVSAGPFSIPLPIQIFEFSLELTLLRAIVRFEIDEDGTMRGFISGALSVQEIVDLSKSVEMGGGQVARLVPVVVAANADLSPDEEGDCQEISVTVVFETTPAFLFE